MQTKIEQTVDYLMEEFPTLSEYQAVKLAIEIERNDILKDAFGVTASDTTPKFLEAIAMALGHTVAK